VPAREDDEEPSAHLGGTENRVPLLAVDGVGRARHAPRIEDSLLGFLGLDGVLGNVVEVGVIPVKQWGPSAYSKYMPWQLLVQRPMLRRWIAIHRAMAGRGRPGRRAVRWGRGCDRNRSAHCAS